MPSIEIDGGTLGYDDEGSGPPIVLVHGWCGDRSHFAAQRDALRDAHRVLVPDLPWHGESERFGEISVPAFTAAVAAFAEAVLHEPALVVGHSMGGMIAITMAAQRPELVTGMIAIDAATAAPAEVQAGLAATLDGLRGPDRQAAAAALAESLFAPGDDGPERTRIAEQMVQAPEALLVEGLASMLTYLSGESDRLLAAAQVPCAVISGDRTALSDHARLLEVNPQAHVAMALGCGHYVQVFAAAQVTAMIERFVELQTTAA